MPYAQVGDIRMYYELHGQGEPLLMIMGLGGHILDWQPIAPAPLDQHYRLILFDNRGAGRTDKPPGPYSLPQMAGDAVGLLEALGLESAHVFGVSMGGMIAQHVALEHPHRVRKLVLGCTMCGPSAGVRASDEVLAYLTPRPDLEPEEALWWSLPASYPEEFIAEHEELLRERIRRHLRHPTPLHAYQAQLDAILNSHDTCERLPELPHRTLVLTGTEDRLIPPENSRILAARIPHAELREIPGAGHVFWVSHPEESVQALVEFLG